MAKGRFEGRSSASQPNTLPCSAHGAPLCLSGYWSICSGCWYGHQEQRGQVFTNTAVSVTVLTLAAKGHADSKEASFLCPAVNSEGLAAFPSLKERIKFVLPPPTYIPSAGIYPNGRESMPWRSALARSSSLTHCLPSPGLHHNICPSVWDIT